MPGETSAIEIASRQKPADKRGTPQQGKELCSVSMAHEIHCLLHRLIGGSARCGSEVFTSSSSTGCPVRYVSAGARNPVPALRQRQRERKKMLLSRMGSVA